MIRRTNRYYFVLMASLIGIGCVKADPTPATAASAPAGLPAPSFGTVAKDIINPDAAGFVALGVTSTQISHPETLKKLAVGLLSGVDPDGNFQSGLAVQFSPLKLFAPKRVTYEAYSQNDGVRALARLEVAAAVVKGADKDKSAKATIGLLWRPIDTTDPYADSKLNGCLDTSFAGKRNTILSPATTPEEIRARDQAIKAYDDKALDCLTDAGKRLANGYSLQISAAPLFVSTTGKTGDFKTQGFTGSGLFTLGLGNLFGAKPSEMKADNKLIIGVVFRSHELVPDPDKKDQFLRRNRLTLGGRLIFGAFDGIIVGGEAAYQHARYAVAGRDDYVTYAATVDYKIADKIWLGANLGGSSGQRLLKSEVSTGLKLKWSFLDSPSIGQ